jgi:hypothetical protein
MGFATSLHTWLTGALAQPLRDVLSSRAARERGIYNLEAISRFWRNRQPAEPRDALRLFHVAQFELWQDVHGD